MLFWYQNIYVPSSNSLFYASNKLFEIKESGFGEREIDTEIDDLKEEGDVERIKCVCVFLFSIHYVCHKLTEPNSDRERELEEGIYR